MLQKGTILNNTYEIIDEIGSGGGGIVYKARHIRLNTFVVVKKIRDELRGKVSSRQEADILKNLKHAYLPRIYDFIETVDAVYTIMDFVPGVSLDKALEKYGRLNITQVQKWAEELGDALAYLHSQNPPIIHSDIKPANIIVTPEGHVCLIDFNISIAFDDAANTTLGFSAGYSSPEQYRDVSNMKTYFETVRLTKLQTGQISNIAAPRLTIDTRSDVYSLGCVLYHAVAGFAPNNDFNKRIPTSEFDGIGEGFAYIIDKMISYEPDDRFRDGKEYYEAVRNCYKLDKSYIRKKRRRVALFVASLLVVFAIMATAGYGIVNNVNEKEIYLQEQIAECNKLLKKGEVDKAVKQITEIEKKNKTRVELYERELYYLYQTGQYQACADRGEEISSLGVIEITKEEQEQILGDFYFVLANAYYEIEDMANANIAIAEAVKHNQQNSLYYRDQCIILARLGKLEQAERALKKAIKLNLEDDSINYANGEICVVKNKTDDAVKYFQKTIDLTQDEVLRKRAVLLCANALRDSNRLEEEVELLLNARNQSGSYERMVITERLADAYMRMGDNAPEQLTYYNEKAIGLFKELMGDGYVTYQLQENMAILYEEINNFDEAKRILNQLSQDYPDNYRVYKRLAFIEADMQQYRDNNNRDYTEMKKYYDRCIELYSNQKEEDAEIHMLDRMIQELRDGGWL